MPVIQNYIEKKSSFLSEPKDMKLIVDKMMKNEELKKLLYYPNEHCLGMPKLTQEQTVEVMRKHVSNIPKILLGGEVKSYIIITFDNYMPSDNPQFRHNMISFDIICHMDTWNLGNFITRPKRIAGELDSMLDKKRLTGIGVLNFVGGNQIILNEELAGFSLNYLATHGEEDKVE